MKLIGFLYQSVFISFKKTLLFNFVSFEQNSSLLKMTNLGFPPPKESEDL